MTLIFEPLVFVPFVLFLVQVLLEWSVSILETESCNQAQSSAWYIKLH